MCLILVFLCFTPTLSSCFLRVRVCKKPKKTKGFGSLQCNSITSAKSSLSIKPEGFAINVFAKCVPFGLCLSPPPHVPPGGKRNGRPRVTLSGWVTTYYRPPIGPPLVRRRRTLGYGDAEPRVDQWGQNGTLGDNGGQWGTMGTNGTKGDLWDDVYVLLES